MFYYNIVRGGNEIDLEARVNGLLRDHSSWRPIGGPITDKHGGWFQALIAPRNAAELAATDSQQLQAAILLVRERAEELFLEPGQLDSFGGYLDLLAKRAAV